APAWTSYQGNLAKAQLRLCFLNIRRVGGQNGSCFSKGCRWRSHGGGGHITVILN
ncbi:unnamed protein product, partial [Musa banksii]